MGHVNDMINRIQANRALQRGPQYFGKMKKELSYGEKKFNSDFANQPESIKKETRDRISLQMTKERKMDLLWMFIFSFLIILFSLVFL